LGGVAFVGGSSLLTACAGDRAPISAANGAIGTFSIADQAFLDEVAETILPATAKSPGAKAAATGPFMALMVTDCYTPGDQEVFRTGLGALDDACRAMHQTSFMEASPEQRTALLTTLDQEQHAYMKARAEEARKDREQQQTEAQAPTDTTAKEEKPTKPVHYFRMMKELALLGFFTSEIGCTRAQRYKETPGPYQACVPYVKGEPAWAGHA
jgi:hypothetical protein